jgi:hypothetical protein
MASFVAVVVNLGGLGLGTLLSGLLADHARSPLRCPSSSTSSCSCRLCSACW